MSDYQAGPSPAVADLANGKTYHPGHPYRRDDGKPGVVTGLVNQVVGYLVAHGVATTREMAEALQVEPRRINDTVKHLRSRGELELAAEPKDHTGPRRWRLAEQARKPEKVIDPAQLPAGPLLPPTTEDLDDAIADLLAMHTGEEGVDPVSAALNRVLLAAEAALKTYLEQRHDPLRDHLQRQVDEAHSAITAWEEKRREQKR